MAYVATSLGLHAATQAPRKTSVRHAPAVTTARRRCVPPALLPPHPTFRITYLVSRALPAATKRVRCVRDSAIRPTRAVRALSPTHVRSLARPASPELSGDGAARGAYGTGGDTPKSRIALAVATAAACRACGLSVHHRTTNHQEGGGRWWRARCERQPTHSRMTHCRTPVVTVSRASDAQPPRPCGAAAPRSSHRAAVRSSPGRRVRCTSVRPGFDGPCCVVAACDAGQLRC
jgi:hypothetical protein